MTGKEVFEKYDVLSKQYKTPKYNVWVKRQSAKEEFLMEIPEDIKKEYKKKKYIQFYHNLLTGDISFYEPTGKDMYFVQYKGKVAQFSCFEYDKKNNIIVGYMYKLKGYSNDPDEKIKEKMTIEHIMGSITFVTPDRSLIAQDFDWKTRTYLPPMLYTEKEILNTPSSLHVDEAMIGVQEAFGEMFEVGFLSGNTYTNFSVPKEALKFLQREPLLRIKSEKQDIIDALIGEKLSNGKVSFTQETKNDISCLIEKVNDEYAVLRYFKSKYNLSPYEISRLYVSKEEHIFCHRNLDGEFLVLNNKLSSAAFDTNNITLIGSPLKGTKLEYFEEIFAELNNAQRCIALYTLIQYSDFEKMYKSGYKNICNVYLNSGGRTLWQNYLKNIFGKLKDDTNINKMLGFNKYQMERIDELYKEDKILNNYYGIGSLIKSITLLEDCNSLDNKSFDKLLEVASRIILDKNEKLLTALIETTRIYSLRKTVEMIDTLMDTSMDFMDYTLRLYTDYLKLVCIMNLSKSLKPNFKDFEDIKRMHDDLLVTYNTHGDIIIKENFAKQSAKWKKWDYNDEDFIIIVPAKPEDIATEGITLHHCVKSYIEKISNGETNVVFIRKKDEIDTPFFTVEISNSDVIEQVHGFANRNADTEPGMVEFVKKWAKEKKLKPYCINKIK